MPALITIADIAKQVGCSKMTVSRALRKREGVSQQRTGQIQKVAAEMGYRPDPMVSALMQRNRQKKPSARSSNLALIHYLKTRDGWQDTEFNRELYAGADARARALGYRLDVVWGNQPELTVEALGRMLLARGIRGVVFLGLPHGRHSVDLDWPQFAAAGMGFSIQSPLMHRSGGYHYHSVPQIVENLLELGYRRMGIGLSRSLDARFEHAWEASVTGLLAKHTQRANIALFLGDGESPELQKWLLDHHFEVFIDAGMRVSERFFEIIDLRIPEDISYVPVMYSIKPDWQAIGSAAVDLVDAQLMRNERGLPRKRKTILIENTWTPPPNLRNLCMSR